MFKYLFFILLTLTGSLITGQNIEELKISDSATGEKRDVLVHTPQGYGEEDMRYEVIYIFDAQMDGYFDMVTATQSIQNYGAFPMIVVGIISNDRNYDFLPSPKNKETATTIITDIGGAGQFLAFIENDLVPQIDERYLTLPQRLGIGYSNGGTFLSYTMLEKPKLFQAYLLIDPNLDYDQGQLIKSLESVDGKVLQSENYLYACGTNTSESWNESQNKFFKTLLGKTEGKIEAEIFSEESHSTVFQIGVLNGIKKYLKYQFFDSSRLIDYYNRLESGDTFKVSSERVLQLIKLYSANGQSSSAAQLFSTYKDRINIDVTAYSSPLELFNMGDVFLSIGERELARKFFTQTEIKLDEFKNSMSLERYKFGKAMLKERFDELDE